MNNLYKELQQSQGSRMAPANNVITNNSNPLQYVQQYMQNPVVKGLLNQYHSPKEAFYAVAKQRGVNPNDILNMLK